MPLSLHAALVPGWLQVLGSCRGLIDKAEAHCAAHGLDEAELVEARLIDDMRPFKYQIKSCTVHSRLAVEHARSGIAGPDFNSSPETLAALGAQLDDTIAFLEALDPAEFETFFGRGVVFTIPGTDYRREYTAENFLLGFSRPNFHFHATTAYALLRMKGVAIGKVDYLGAWPTRG